MLKPSINKSQYNKNLDQIIASNKALIELLDLMVDHLSVNDTLEFTNKIIEQKENGKNHLLNLNILLKNLKR